jgi:hypothetical protein
MERLRRSLRYWLAMAFAWSLSLAVVLAVQHQLLRLQANDPQVQMAEDAAARLVAGAGPELVLPPGGDVAIEHSLAPWLLVYDASGTPLAGSGRLHGALPRMPGGVLPFARAHGGHRLSWQPEAGVRQALVIVPVRGGGKDPFRRCRALAARSGATQAASAALPGPVVGPSGSRRWRHRHCCCRRVETDAILNRFSVRAAVAVRAAVGCKRGMSRERKCGHG